MADLNRTCPTCGTVTAAATDEVVLKICGEHWSSIKRLIEVDPPYLEGVTYPLVTKGRTRFTMNAVVV